MKLTLNEATCETEFIPLCTHQRRSQHIVDLVTMSEPTKYYVSACNSETNLAYHA